MRLITILLPALAALTEAATLHGCAGKCIGEAIASTGCSSADSSCICSSDSFLSSINECVPQTCNPDEQDAAITFAQEFCHKIELAKRGTETSEPHAGQVERRSESSSWKNLVSWPWHSKRKAQPQAPPHVHKAAPYHVPWYQKREYSVISPPSPSWYTVGTVGSFGTVGTVYGGAAHWPPPGGPGKWGVGRWR